ncbi:MAG TPA: hypothetical protein VH912_23800 [Streptosporangiaceae bacterium]
MLPYAAYLRVYEPLSAFPEPDRSAWARYAASESRPRRATALVAEHAAALQRLVAIPPVVAPARESGDAYVRRTADTTFICPWQIRLRSWLAFAIFRACLPPGVADSFAPRPVADQVTADFERWKRQTGTMRSYILCSTWHVPLVWFVPFDAAERCLVLEPPAAPGRPEAREQQPDSAGAQAEGAGAQAEGASGQPEGAGVQAEPGGGAGLEGRPEGAVGGPTTTTPARALLYVTSMAEARQRVAQAIRAVRDAPEADGTAGGFEVGDVATLGRWLEGFHPHALVELDYGGLVHVMDDKTLRADESVAEVAAVLQGMERDRAVALAMYERVQARWRSVRVRESAN